MNNYQDVAQEIVGGCVCIPAYKDRDLVDPQCSACQFGQEIINALHTAYIEGGTEMAAEIRLELFGLCEETEEGYREAALDRDGKQGTFARGRIKEAKSIRNAMSEVIRQNINSIINGASMQDLIASGGIFGGMEKL